MHESTGERFTRWVAENGYELSDDYVWVNTRTRYPAKCPRGHECTLLPSTSLSRGSGCRDCGHARRATAKTENARLRFLAWIDAAGFTLTEDFEWSGMKGNTRYEASCPEGHPCKVSPNAVQQGQSGCDRCSRRRLGRYPSSERSRHEFLAWGADNGYTFVDFEWLGTMQPHPAICPNGHDCRPTPCHVRAGIGGCAACKNKVFDVFYVVVDEAVGVVKFGITSGNPAPRLRDHRKDGFTEVVRLFRGMGQGEAATLERELLRLLKCAGVAPVRRREYFPVETLNTILYVTDGWVSD